MLVDEPTAAALCYTQTGLLQNGQKFLLYDFGGGTFDVSVLQYKESGFSLLAEPMGISQCGGIDMDRKNLNAMNFTGGVLNVSEGSRQ